jgi:hypothetical protein
VRGGRANLQLADHDVLKELDRLADSPVVPAWVGLAKDRDRIRETGYMLRKPWVIDSDPLSGDLAYRRAWTAGATLPATPPAPSLRHRHNQDP